MLTKPPVPYDFYVGVPISPWGPSRGLLRDCTTSPMEHYTALIQVPHEKCKHVPEKQCIEVPYQVPKKIPHEVCQDIPYEKCHSVPEKIPKQIPKVYRF